MVNKSKISGFPAKFFLDERAETGPAGIKKLTCGKKKTGAGVQPDPGLFAQNFPFR